MNVKIFSADFDRNSERCRIGITNYLKDLNRVGLATGTMLFCDNLNKYYICVDINKLEDIIKIANSCGTILFDGEEITIYDGYIE